MNLKDYHHLFLKIGIKIQLSTPSTNCLCNLNPTIEAQGLGASEKKTMYSVIVLYSFFFGRT